MLASPSIPLKDTASNSKPSTEQQGKHWGVRLMTRSPVPPCSRTLHVTLVFSPCSTPSLTSHFTYQTLGYQTRKRQLRIPNMIVLR